MREKNLHLDGRAVRLQVLQSRKQPLRRVWIGKMSSFPRLELQKTPKSTPGAAVLYIRGARVRWGRRRKRRETRKFSGLDSPGGTSGASKSDSFPVCVRFLSRNVRRTVAPRPATPPRMSCFGRFCTQRSAGLPGALATPRGRPKAAPWACSPKTCAEYANVI